MPTLLGKSAQVRWQHTQEESFSIVNHLSILYDVPTEVVPELSSCLAPSCSVYPMPEVSLTNVNRHRAIVENVDARTTLLWVRDTTDVCRVPRPHFPIFAHKSHDKPPKQQPLLLRLCHCFTSALHGISPASQSTELKCSQGDMWSIDAL